jgi:hypothetical protein
MRKGQRRATYSRKKLIDSSYDIGFPRSMCRIKAHEEAIIWHEIILIWKCRARDREEMVTLSHRSCKEREERPTAKKANNHVM